MIRRLLETRLVLFDLQWNDWSEILNAAQHLSLAEIVRAADESAKQAVLFQDEKIDKENLLATILERREMNLRVLKKS
jgi:hypothetical protein